MLIEDPGVLRLYVPAKDLFDEASMKRIKFEGGELVLRHSLKAIRYWEQLTKKSWFFTFEKSPSDDDIILYIKCMVINDVKDPNIIHALERDEYSKIIEYLNDPMTATTIGKKKDRPRKPRKVTCEEIYAALTSYGMPIEYLETWNFNQVNMLIMVRSELENPSGKTSMTDKYKRNAERQARKKRPKI